MTSTKGSIVITGANGGLGAAIVSQIVSTPLGKEYHGVYTVRNPASPGALGDALRKGPGHKHDVVALDLSSIANVRTAAETINRRVAEGSIPRIKALILNAGYQDATQLTMSPDGFEMGFQVNHLSQFLFTLLLLQSMDVEHGRICVVGSWSHDPNDPKNNIANVKGSMLGYEKGLLVDIEAVARGKWSTPAEDPTYHAGYRRYGATKLCEMMFMHELAARIATDSKLRNVSVVGVDPGGMATGLLRRGSLAVRVLGASGVVPLAFRIAERLNPNGMLRTPGKSARDVLSACFELEGAEFVYMNGNEKGQTSEEARDEGKRTMVWRESVKWAEMKEGETVLERWQ